MYTEEITIQQAAKDKLSQLYDLAATYLDIAASGGRGKYQSSVERSRWSSLVENSRQFLLEESPSLANYPGLIQETWIRFGNKGDVNEATANLSEEEIQNLIVQCKILCTVILEKAPILEKQCGWIIGNRDVIESKLLSILENPNASQADVDSVNINEGWPFQ